MDIKMKPENPDVNYIFPPTDNVEITSEGVDIAKWVRSMDIHVSVDNIVIADVEFQLHSVKAKQIEITDKSMENLAEEIGQILEALPIYRVRSLWTKLTSKFLELTNP